MPSAFFSPLDAFFLMSKRSGDPDSIGAIFKDTPPSCPARRADPSRQRRRWRRSRRDNLPASGTDPKRPAGSADLFGPRRRHRPDRPTGTVSLVRLACTMHCFDQNQRYVPLVFEVDQAAQAPTLIVEAPGNANLAPPGYYMLFLISDDGVPSVAKYVRLE